VFTPPTRQNSFVASALAVCPGHNINFTFFVEPGNWSPWATNVVIVVVLLLGVVVIRFSIPYSSVISQPIVMKPFAHINGTILDQATVADFFLFRP